MKINTKAIKKSDKIAKTNYQGGGVFDIINPLLKLKIIASSCFFGEPSYYVSDEKKESDTLSLYKYDYGFELSELSKSLKPDLSSGTTVELMEKAIDNALNFDIVKTLEFASQLRNVQNIRTTPQVILVRAANNINSKHTKLIREFAREIIKRTDEPTIQLAYQINNFGKPIPNSLKRAWKDYLNTQGDVSLAKYRKSGYKTKLVDVVNLSHANNKSIDKLMNDNLRLEDSTWESFISKHGSTKETWIEAIPKMGHMALLRNLRNFIKFDVPNKEFLPKLVETASKGKQLPFRYYSAFESVKNSNYSIIGEVQDSLDECLELSLGNLPKLSGKSLSICDNSGSTQSPISLKSNMHINVIGNLCGILVGKVSDSGSVALFAHNEKFLPVRKKDSVLSQLNEFNRIGMGLGGSTEPGLFKIFAEIISKNEVYDNIFIFSDMQVGSISDFWCWGNDNEIEKYSKEIRDCKKFSQLINLYRKKVNKNFRLFSVDVAGYGDTLIPEFYDKTYLFGGWGDGIIHYASKVIELENSI